MSSQFPLRRPLPPERRELDPRDEAKTGATGGWTLRDGYRLDLDALPIRIEPFREIGLPIREAPDELARSAEEMSCAQLRDYVDRLVSSGASATRYRSGENRPQISERPLKGLRVRCWEDGNIVSLATLACLCGAPVCVANATGRRRQAP